MAHGCKQFCFWGWGKVAGGIGYGADQRSARLTPIPSARRRGPCKPNCAKSSIPTPA